MDQDDDDLDELEATGQKVEKTARISNYFGTDVPSIEAQVVEAAPFVPPVLAAISRESETETLLNGLIAEMHYIMRELALPTAAAAQDIDVRRRCIATTIDLALAGAKVGKTVAGLRAVNVPRAARTTTETVEVVGAAPKNC